MSRLAIGRLGEHPAARRAGRAAGSTPTLDSESAYTYTRGVPNLTIYVDRDLAERFAATGQSTSKVCQNAMRRQVRLHEREAARQALIAATASTTIWRTPTSPQRSA